jgi:hypothetical protein
LKKIIVVDDDDDDDNDDDGLGECAHKKLFSRKKKCSFFNDNKS